MTLTEWLEAITPPKGKTKRKWIAENLDMTESMVSQVLKGRKPLNAVDAMRLVVLSKKKIDLNGLLEMYAPFMGRKHVKRGGRRKAA